MKYYKLKLYTLAIKLPFKLTILIVLISCTGKLSIAQSNSANSPFAIYTHIGINASQVQNDGLGGFDKLSPMAGLGVSKTISQNFALAFELNYIGKGSKKNLSSTNADPNYYRINLSYIQVPVLLVTEFEKKFNFSCGPAFSALISAKEKDYYGTSVLTEEYEPIEFAIIAGATYQISPNLICELRFDQSLLSIRKAPETQSPNYTWKQYNTSLGVYLAYFFKPKS